MKRIHIRIFSALLLSIVLGASAFLAAAQDSQPVVHAVLFYSPTCPHCEYVITEVLPPLMRQYGSQLQIIGFDVSHSQGEAMFYSALDRFGLQQASVPLLVIDNITLVGSEEIPQKFPALIETYLKLGGVDWPDIPGLHEMLIAAAQTATAEARGAEEEQPSAPAPGLSTVEPERLGWQQRFAADPVANTIALVVLAAMLAGVVWAFLRFRRGAGPSIKNPALTMLIPAVCILGLVVAGYLAYVEATGTNAVCGPIGDCNTVQQSPYSHLFGVLSIGGFGLIGYALIFAAWASARFGKGRAAIRATSVLFFLSLAGTLFSSYLTFLEPFVIGATCAWCLTSAVLMTALMLLTVGPAGRALSELREKAGASETRSPRPRPLRPR